MSVRSGSRLFAAALALQALVAVLLVLDALGVGTGAVSYVVGFVYLTFVPGFLILINLKLLRLGLLETLLFSVGLSLVTVMLTGLLLQLALPPLGVSRPLSTMPVGIALGALVLALWLLALRRVRATPLAPGNWQWPSFGPALLLVLLVLLGVLGGNEMTALKTASGSLVTIGLVALIPLLVIFDRFIKSNAYPWAIMAIALSLLLTQTMRGAFLTGFLDVHMEAYFHQLTLASASWDMTIPHDYNSMLSVGILPTMYALITKIPSNEIFRVFYPLIYALVPVALYAVFARLWDEKAAFLGAFFFVATSSFFTELAFIPRQGYAELFFSLWLLTMVSGRIPQVNKVALGIVFGIGIITSHYGLSYVLMGYLFVAWGLLALRRVLANRRAARSGRSGAGRSGADLPSSSSTSPILTVTSGSFVAFFIVAALGWYIFVGQAKLLQLIVGVGEQVLGSIGTGLFDITTRPTLVTRALGFGQTEPGMLYWTYRITFYLTALFVAIGVLATILKRAGRPATTEYLAFAVTSLALLGAAVVLPYFGDFLNMPRIYHISLLVLAPFCVIGGRIVFRWLLSRLKRLSPGPGAANVLVGLVLVAYFLFQTGLPFVLAGIPSMNRFNIASIEERGTAEDRATFYSSEGYIFQQDMSGLDWLIANRNEKARVFADITNSHKALASYAMIYQEVLDLYPQGTMPWVEAYRDYAYLSYTNVVTGFLSYLQWGAPNWTLYPLDTVEPLLKPSSRVYANGVAEIWLIGGPYPGSVWRPDED